MSFGRIAQPDIRSYDANLRNISLTCGAVLGTVYGPSAARSAARAFARSVVAVVVAAVVGVSVAVVLKCAALNQKSRVDQIRCSRATRPRVPALDGSDP